MNRSTTLYIAIATLVLGSGTSFFAFVQPALTEQGKLKTQKAGLETQKASLQAQVKDLEGKATSAAMLDIAFFDLRVSLNQRRELETKTVQTLASLTEIFNDHKIRVQELTPTGETQGLNKPVPSAAPSGSPAPGTAPGTAPAAPAAAPGTTPAGAAGTPSPIQLTHKTFKLKVRGEYSDMVKALNEIQGLPRAISVNQYDLQLLDKTADVATPAKPDQKGRVETATALEMGFQVSITFLMAGGTPPQPAPAAAVGALPSADGLQAFVTWLLGGEARAAEQVAGVPHALPSVAAPQAAANAKYRLNGVSIQNGAVRLQTSGGTPSYSLVGITRHKAVLELANTAIAPGAEREAAGAGAIRGLSVSAPKPGVVRIVVETDGSRRLKASLDRYERLQLVTAPWNELPRVAKTNAPLSGEKRKASTVAARPVGKLTRLQDVTFENGELLVHTSGPSPRFESLGGTKTRLVIELPHAGITAPGKVFPIQAGGIAQVRAVLYKNKPMITRLVVDTDGSVRLTPYEGADGRLRVRVAPFAAQAPGVKPQPIAAKPAKPAQAAIVPNAPKATPTPMAKPAAKVPLAQAKKPAPRASHFPEDDTAGPEGPHLQRSLNSSYAFPIERERTTGRANPFKVLPNRAKPKPAVDANGMPVPPAMPMGRPPMLPPPGVAGQAPMALPGLPAAPAKVYALSAVVLGGAQPPVAAIKVDGKTHLVGLNETLPGNARVKSIKADHVVLSTGNQELRIGLKK